MKSEAVKIRISWWRIREHWSKAGRRGPETRASPAAVDGRCRARVSTASAANYNAKPVFVLLRYVSQVRKGGLFPNDP